MGDIETNFMKPWGKLYPNIFIEKIIQFKFVTCSQKSKKLMQLRQFLSILTCFPF